LSLLNSIDVEFHSRETAVVALRGEHDLYSIDQLVRALDLAGGCPSILVDAHAAAFIDSSAINAVLRAARRARTRGGALELVVSQTGAVRRALEIAGIPALLPMHESRGVGLASLEASAQLEAHRTPRRGLSMAIARIEQLEAKTEARRNGRTTAIRAHVTDPASSAARIRPA